MHLLCRLGIHRPLSGHNCEFVDSVSGKEVYSTKCPCGEEWLVDSRNPLLGDKCERKQGDNMTGNINLLHEDEIIREITKKLKNDWILLVGDMKGFIIIENKFFTPDTEKNRDFEMLMKGIHAISFCKRTPEFVEFLQEKAGKTTICLKAVGSEEGKGFRFDTYCYKEGAFDDCLANMRDLACAHLNIDT